MIPCQPTSSLFPYTTLFRSNLLCQMGIILSGGAVRLTGSGLGCSSWPNCEPGQFTPVLTTEAGDRKSTRLNSSHVAISYAVFCLKKKNHTAKIYSTRVKRNR